MSSSTKASNWPATGSSSGVTETEPAIRMVAVGNPYENAMVPGLSGWTPSGYDAASRPLCGGRWVPVGTGARGDPFAAEWRNSP